MRSFRPPSRRASRAGLILLVSCVLLSGGVPWAGPPPAKYRGRPLVEVLRELQSRGLPLIFSSAVVAEDLRVTTEPATDEPRAALQEILWPLGLDAEDGPSGSVLIVPLDPDSGRLAGRVLSLPGARPLPGASIRIPDTGHATTSGKHGAFELRGLPIGNHDMVVEAFGFSTMTLAGVSVTREGASELTVRLRAQPTFITEVVVTPNRYSMVREQQAIQHTVTQEEAALAPTVGGEITRVVELLPGVAAADNTAAFNVRGSTAQDVSMVLDGLELYDPFHLHSFQSPFSLVDSNIVDTVEFFGGGFTADLGDRHGGFVEISTAAPDSTALGQVELGTLNSRVSYQSLSSNGSASWLVSGRLWYPEAVRHTTELGAGENLDPRLGDVYAKAAFQVTPRQRLSVHGLASYDRLTYVEVGEDINERVEALTRNGYGWLRLASVWAPGVTSETLLSGGRIERIRDGLSAEDSGIVVDDDRVVEFYGLKNDTIWKISDSHLIKAGADVRLLSADYRYSNVVDDDPQESSSFRLDPRGTTLGAYAAYRARITSTFATEVGARWDRQTFTSDNQLSPRFNAVWKPNERSEVRLALGRFSQSQRIHELHVEDGETEFLGAELARQAEVSFQHRFGSGIQFRVDAYDRKISDLRPRYENLFEPIELFPETTGDRIVLEPEEARLRGVELLLRGATDRRWFWWIGYAYSSAEDVIDGREVPRNWDQPHAGKFLVGYRGNDRWSVALSGSVHTGWPNTPVLPEVTTAPDGTIEIEPIPGGRNTDRYDTYGRLDFKARRSLVLPRGRLWFTLEVINLTDRANPCCLDEAFFDPRSDGSIDVRRRFDTWNGRTPSFNVLWEF